MKKFIVLLIVLLVSFSAVFAGGSTEKAAAAAESSSGGNALNTEKEFTLHFMTTPQWQGVWDRSEPNADYPDFWKYVGGKFTELHPNVKVDVQIVSGSERSAILNSNLQAGTQPDIFYESVFAMTDYAHAGVLVDLSDIISDEERQNLNAANLSEGNLGGKQFFYPLGSAVGTLVVNADIFREAGLGDLLPGEGEVGEWTVEEFTHALKTLKEKITRNGFYPFGVFCKNNQSDQFNNLYLRMFGAEMFNEDSTACIINSPEGIKAAEYLKEIYDLGYIEPGPETYAGSDIRTMFLNKNLAIGYFTSAHYTTVLSDMENGKTEKFNMCLFTIPSVNGPMSYGSSFASCVFENADPEQTAWAKEFVKFYSAGEYSKAVFNEGVPSRASDCALYSDVPYIKAYQSIAKYNKDFSGGIPNYIAFRNVLYPTMQAIFTGSMSPKEALDSLAEKATALIHEGMEESVLY